ncbi:MAG: family 1 encapsulin nanocompartment shell protein [Candidatus Acetothermia bacterium]
MDLLKRNLAPITDEGWEEIDETAREVLYTHLSARRFVDVSEPQGWEFSALPQGRLEIQKQTENDEVNFGIRKNLPVVETRLSFDLEIWELDDIVRGAEDIDLDPLEEAVEKAARFEEKALYSGLEEGCIEGLREASALSLKMEPNPQGILQTLSEGVATFRDQSIEGPYYLVVNRRSWQDLNAFTKGYPLKRQTRDLLDAPIIYSQNVEDPLLLSGRGGDFELTLGKDFSIGYQNHDKQTVTLFVTESFAFRVLEPAAVIALETTE